MASTNRGKWVEGVFGNCISKISSELRHLPIPQLIALITCACNRDRNIVPPYKHLQFTYNAWGQLQFMI